MTRLKLEDVAHTIVCVPYFDEGEGDEALAAEFVGAYSTFYVCPPGTLVDALEIPRGDNSDFGDLVHEDATCVVISVDHI